MENQPVWNTTRKVSKYGVFLVLIFLYLDWIRRFSPYSVPVQENMDQKSSVFGHFSRSDSIEKLISLKSISQRTSQRHGLFQSNWYQSCRLYKNTVSISRRWIRLLKALPKNQVGWNVTIVKCGQKPHPVT